MDHLPETQNLLTLPDEVLLRLLGFLPNLDLQRCRLVHPLLQHLVDKHPTPEIQLSVVSALLGEETAPAHYDNAAKELKRKEQDLIAWSALGEQNSGSEMRGPFELLISDITRLIDHPSWRFFDPSDIHFSTGKLLILSHAFSHIHSPTDHPESFVPIFPLLLSIDVASDEHTITEWVDSHADGSHIPENLPIGVTCSQLPAMTVAYHFFENFSKVALVSIESQDGTLRMRVHHYVMSCTGLKLLNETSPLDLASSRFCRCAIQSTQHTLIVHIASTCASGLSYQDPVQVRPLSELTIVKCPLDSKSPPERIAFSEEDDTLEGLKYSAPTLVALDDQHVAIVTLSQRGCCLPPAVKIIILDITRSAFRKVGEISIPRDTLAKHNPNNREVHLCACCARSSIYFIRACRLRVLRVGSSEDRLVFSINMVNRFFAGDCSFNLGSVASIIASSGSDKSKEWSGDIMMEWDQSQCQAWSHPSWGSKFFGECFSSKQKDFLWSFGYNVPKRRLRGIESDPKRAKWLGLVDKEDTSASWKGGNRDRHQAIRPYHLTGRNDQYVPYESNGEDGGVVPVLGSSFGPKTGSPSVIGVDKSRIVITSKSEETGAQAIWVCNIPQAMAKAAGAVDR